MTVDMLVIKVKEYYKNHIAGGSLHIVLDDGNLETSSVLFCIEWAKNKNDKEGEDLAKLLLATTEEERQALYERYDEYCWLSSQTRG